MKPSLAILILLLFCILVTPAFSLAEKSWENCVDEICDGLDNDCDKAIDDNVDCGANLQCGCAHCNKAMVDGKCATGVPWEGFCLEDHCLPGTACNIKSGKCRPR